MKKNLTKIYLAVASLGRKLQTILNENAEADELRKNLNLNNMLRVSIY